MFNSYSNKKFVVFTTKMMGPRQEPKRKFLVYVLKSSKALSIKYLLERANERP